MTNLLRAAQRYAVVTETWRPQINGVANTLGRLCDGLLARGSHLQLVRPAQADECTGVTDQGSLQQMLVKGLPTPGYPQLQFGLPAYRLLLTHWQQHRPDAVYLATKGPLGWSALRAARRLNIPVISGFHTTFQQYGEHYLLGLLNGPATVYLRWFHNQTQATLSASLSQHQELYRMGIRNPKLLGRGVDCEQFHPTHRDNRLRRSWGARDEDLVLLHVGRLAAEKNLDLLQRSWQHVKQHKASGVRVCMVVVGDGPQRKQLQQDMPGVIFTGTLTGTALSAAYASADIFLFPSLTDTFGNVVTEAMASGLAVVAFDTAAAHQHIRDRYSGCLAPPADNQQFMQNLGWLLKNREGLRGVRMHARHRACQLDWSAVLGRFEGYLQHHCTAPVSIQAAVPGQ